jgi:PhnB protein
MSTINPYLNFSGNTEEAFDFYKTVFGGDYLAVQRFKDFPEGHKLPPEDQNKIMHISLPISNGYLLMGTDTLESMGQTTTVGNNFYISVQVESKKEADRIFNELSAGGKIEMHLQDTFWGAYFGMFADKFGIQWMINYDYPENS